MERTSIISAVKSLESKEDLLVLLNIIKRGRMKEMGLLDKFMPFKMRHINYYCNPNHEQYRFRQFQIKKKSGGFRQITAPNHTIYRSLLQCVNELLKTLYTPTEYAMGFTKGKSIVDNATIHRGQNYVFNTDLKDFFPSVDQARVWKRLQLPPFGFPERIASLIAGMCAMKDVREENGTQKVRYVLPQGAPTSPIITNMICDTLDRRLAGLAKRFGLVYSRYADDITFSSMHNVYQKDGEFRQELHRIIEGQNLKINENKTRLQIKGSRQEVTGLIVSDNINVTQQYMRDLRSILYIWKQYGYWAAKTKFEAHYKASKGHIKKANANMENVIEGKLLYLKMVRGEEDVRYQRLYKQFEGLIKPIQDKDNTNSHGVKYIETTPLETYEQIHHTAIEIISQSDGKRYAQFTAQDKHIVASVHKYLLTEQLQDKKQLAISYCADKDGKNFWLIHHINKLTQFTQEVDIDNLNRDLDELLKL